MNMVCGLSVYRECQPESMLLTERARTKKDKIR